jgi:hypothetical protein
MMQGYYSLRDPSLSLFGLFEYVVQDLEGEISFESNLHTGSIEAKHGQDVVAGLKQTMSPPIVILDEFAPWEHDESATESEKYKARNLMMLLRNAFTCLGCAVLVMSSDSEVVKLVPSFMSRGSSNPPPWCLVRSQFPKPVFKEFSSYGHCFRELLLNSRPLFGRQLAELAQVHEDTTLEVLLAEVSKRVSKPKRSFDELGFVGGQFALFMNNTTLIDHSKLIQCHFADLTGQFSAVDMNAHLSFERKDGFSQTWRPIASFPQMGEDVLLYLCLMGLPGAPPFILDESEVSFSYAWRELYRFGISSEVVSSIAASHSGGLRGTNLRSFLINLHYHLSLRDTPNTLDLDLSIWENVVFINNFMVPMLSPPGKDWPEFLTQHGFNLASTWKYQEQAMLEFNSSCGISGDSQDYAEAISPPMLLDILHRIPAHSSIHLILVDKLQRSYFGPSFKRRKTSLADYMYGGGFSFQQEFGGKFDTWGFYCLSNSKLHELQFKVQDYESPTKESIKHIAIFISRDQLHNMKRRGQINGMIP